MNDDNVLIIITDEVGSTDRDCLAHNKDEILIPRIKYFKEQIQRVPKGARIIKSVGDSLVITCKNDLIIDVVKSVFDSWLEINKNFGTKIRTVVHKTRNKNYWANGAKILNDLKNIQNIKLKWKYYENLEEDIFGLEMNLVARIASIPTKHSFVVTESIFYTTEGQLDINILNELNSFFGGKQYTIGPQIPIAYLKGFDNHIDLEPLPPKRTLSIAEIIPSRTKDLFITVQDDTNFLYDDLIFDSKKHQIIRTIYIKGRYKDEKNNINDTPPLKDDVEKIKIKILESLKQENNRLNYFIDFLFEIVNIYEALPINISRKFVPKEKDNFFTIEKFYSLKPLFLMFNSNFDEKNDNIIAEKIENIKIALDVNKDINSTLDAKILTESQKVFQRTCWLYDHTTLNLCWLLLFQVNIDVSEDPDKPEIFSNLVHQKILNMDIVAFGLLKGTYDGFMLLQQNDNRSEENIITDFNNFYSGKIDGENYGYIYLPNHLYSLKYINYKSNADKLKLYTIEQNLYFKDFTTWKELIEVKR